MDYPIPDRRYCDCGKLMAIYPDTNPHQTRCSDCQKKLHHGKHAGCRRKLAKLTADLDAANRTIEELRADAAEVNVIAEMRRFIDLWCPEHDDAGWLRDYIRRSTVEDFLEKFTECGEAEEGPDDTTTPPIEDVIEELAAEAPAEDWDKLRAGACSIADWDWIRRIAREIPDEDWAKLLEARGEDESG